MKLSVIFTTYNAPDWLEKVLWGFTAQTVKDFEVLIADDGSGSETAARIKHMQEMVRFPIRHIWQEDNGFRKCEILNKAIVAAKADYLVFTDGDCIPRKDFLEVHLNKRKEKHFLSGGLIRLPLDLSRKITKDDILTQKVFEKKWLKVHGYKKQYLKQLKLTQKSSTAAVMNKITPTTASWNGHNASTWKKYALAVNGFDERMRYGGEDREFGERLINLGLKSSQIRYSAVCLHLDHSRGYVTEEDLQKNREIRKQTKREKRTTTAFGIHKNKAY